MKYKVYGIMKTSLYSTIYKKNLIRFFKRLKTGQLHIDKILVRLLPTEW